MFATVEVEQALLGDLPKRFVVQQSGGPVLEASGEPLLAELRADPLLLPGDRAVLFLSSQDVLLEHEQGLPVFTVLPWTGRYGIERDGTLAPIPENPFANDVAGKTIQAFAELVRVAAATP